MDGGGARNLQNLVTAAEQGHHGGLEVNLEEDQSWSSGPQNLDQQALPCLVHTFGPSVGTAALLSARQPHIKTNTAADWLLSSLVVWFPEGRAEDELPVSSQGRGQRGPLIYVWPQGRWLQQNLQLLQLKVLQGPENPGNTEAVRNQQARMDRRNGSVPQTPNTH